MDGGKAGEAQATMDQKRNSVDIDVIELNKERERERERMIRITDISLAGRVLKIVVKALKVFENRLVDEEEEVISAILRENQQKK